MKKDPKYRDFLWRARGLEANLRSLAHHRYSPPGIRQLSDQLGRLIRQVESGDRFKERKGG